MIGRDEVAITVWLHEMDFVALLRACRLIGMPRDEMVRRAIASHLVALQRQGLDLGIVLPEQAEASEGQKQPVADAKASAKDGGDGKTP